MSVQFANDGVHPTREGYAVTRPLARKPSRPPDDRTIARHAPGAVQAAAFAVLSATLAQAAPAPRARDVAARIRGAFGDGWTDNPVDGLVAGQPWPFG